jgi:hypothetical protein
VEINKRKGAGKKSSGPSKSDEMQLPPYSPQKDVQIEEQVLEKPETPVKARPRRRTQHNNDGELIQAQLNKSLGNLESPQEVRIFIKILTQSTKSLSKINSIESGAFKE